MEMHESAAQLRAVGYTRVSTDEQRNRPKDDRERIAALCLAKNYELVDFIQDIDVSSDVPLERRENGRRVHRLIEARQPWADVLIVTSLDRLTREPAEGMALIERLTPGGSRRHYLALVALDQGIDLSGPFGPFIAGQFVLAASLEKTMIRWRTSNALKHKRRSGIAYAATPFGWDRTGDHAACEPGKCVCRLVPNEAEQAVIEEMRRWRAEGVNDGTIARRLNERGVVGKRGGKWYATSIYNTLRTAGEVGTEVAE